MITQHDGSPEPLTEERLVELIDNCAAGQFVPSS